MKYKLRLKLLLYRFFLTKFGKKVLNLLSFGVKVKNLKGSKTLKKYPFLIAITIDTESGYVAKDEYRVWQKEKPKSFIGYYFGIRNIASVLDKHKIRATFLLSTQCFSSKNEEYEWIMQELSKATKAGHEIGLHLHPDSDFALQKKLEKKFDRISAFYYDYDTKLSMLLAAKHLVKENLGDKIAEQIASFRWGNWALDSEGVKALNELGFKVDSSAIPGFRYNNKKSKVFYDWSKIRTREPWILSTENYQDTSQKNSGIIELPIATFEFFGRKLRADPVNSLLLIKSFLKYHKMADTSKKPFVFVVMTHSSEATYFDGSNTQALKDLDKFISFAKTYKDVKFVTLKEAANRVVINKIPNYRIPISSSYQPKIRI